MPGIALLWSYSLSLCLIKVEQDTHAFYGIVEAFRAETERQTPRLSLARCALPEWRNGLRDVLQRLTHQGLIAATES